MRKIGSCGLAAVIAIVVSGCGSKSGDGLSEKECADVVAHWVTGYYESSEPAPPLDPDPMLEEVLMQRCRKGDIDREEYDCLKAAKHVYEHETCHGAGQIRHPNR